MIKNECGHAYKLLDHAECLWCENCVEELVERLIQKPVVTEKWIDKKAKEMCKIANVEFFIYAQDFVRSITEEIGDK